SAAGAFNRRTRPHGGNRETSPASTAYGVAHWVSASNRLSRQSTNMRLGTEPIYQIRPHALVKTWRFLDGAPADCGIGPIDSLHDCPTARVAPSPMQNCIN